MDFLKLLNDWFGGSNIPSQRQLIEKESKIGAELFGPIPKGHRREFFCLDETAMVWYEEWEDMNGQTQSMTTRYEVHPNGILKAQDGQQYSYVTEHEARNLLKAAQLYSKRVRKEVYGKPINV